MDDEPDEGNESRVEESIASAELVALRFFCGLLRFTALCELRLENL